MTAVVFNLGLSKMFGQVSSPRNQESSCLLISVCCPKSPNIGDGVSNKTFQPARQSSTRRLARTDDLLPSLLQQISNLRVFKGQIVPHLGQLFLAHLQRLGQLVNTRYSCRRKQRDATPAFIVSQIEQQRHALL